MLDDINSYLPEKLFQGFVEPVNGTIKNLFWGLFFNLRTQCMGMVLPNPPGFGFGYLIRHYYVEEILVFDKLYTITCRKWPSKCFFFSKIENFFFCKNETRHIIPLASIKLLYIFSIDKVSTIPKSQVLFVMVLGKRLKRITCRRLKQHLRVVC